MTLQEEMQAELVTLNETTTKMGADVAETADDIDDLISKIGTPGIPEADVQAALTSLKEKNASLKLVSEALTATAAKWTK